MTPGQRTGLEQLRDIEGASGGSLEIVRVQDDHSFLRIEIAVACDDIVRKDGGLPLRDRERLILLLPEDFPFAMPHIQTRHTRFAGFPHVQWNRNLCLYQAPGTEWDVSDGMFGLIDRLDRWLRDGAIGELNPTGQPLHPPVTYTGLIDKTVVPRIDTPRLAEAHWFGLAELQPIHEDRVDIVNWHPFFEGNPQYVAAAILLATPMPYEFPGMLTDLLEELIARGVQRSRLLLTLQIAAWRNPEDSPLYVILGTPMRGVKGGELLQHLTAWYFPPVIAKALRLSTEKYNASEQLQDLGQEVEDLIWKWASEVPVAWCYVREARPEVTIRRDNNSAATWFKGRTIAVWGCGALGGPVAEHLARAGAKKLILRDHAIVTPGILVRQPYNDQDIGKPKVDPLADRLKKIAPELLVDVHCTNLLSLLDQPNWTDNADLIIDAAASSALQTKLELRRRAGCSVPITAFLVSQRAERGIMVLAQPKHSGGPADLVRHAKLEVCNRLVLQRYRDAFWPSERVLFQPEPGCSEPTFLGSAADLATMAGMLLNLAATSLAKSNAKTGSAWFTSQPYAANPLPVEFSWDRDHVLYDLHTDYEIRVAPSAWREMLAWQERSKRTTTRATETGGLLFGERDDAARILWISEASGPPPDSIASPVRFVCGVRGTAELNQEKQKRSQGAVQFVGMWHTHPDELPLPSTTDLAAVDQITTSAGITPRRILMLIIGRVNKKEGVGAFLLGREDLDKVKAGTFERVCTVQRVIDQPTQTRIGLALSGGGSRAIAFHLGCLRALNDRGILDQVKVLSTVSGGSVIGALYAYGNETFQEFDARIVRLLRTGVDRGILKKLLRPDRGVATLAVGVTAGIAAIGADLSRFALSRLTDATWVRRVQPPLRRGLSLTTAFASYLRDELGDLRLDAPRRRDMNVIINACELRTGSAFRFGSKESGCWRYGKVKDNMVSVAAAVAASAAYPVLLPALDRRYQFLYKGTENTRRVLLTDGGVFDNLGVTCLEPGRSETYSTNVVEVDYILCCDAGSGLLDDTTVPAWWGSRMTRAFENVFRKVQNSGVDRLHRYAENGSLKGFLYAYLGQQDQQLPLHAPDLVRRETVMNYPTNFAPMDQATIDKLALRGEQLTRLLIERYCPEL